MFKILILSIVLPVGVACVPATNYVRTASIASPTGETLTLPMHDNIELSGSFGFVDHHPLVVNFEPYKIEDPLVNPALWQFSGLARFSVHENIAIGLHGDIQLVPSRHYYNLPLNNDLVWGLGPNIGVHFHPWSDKFTIAFSFALTLMASPWTVWERTTPPSNLGYTFLFDPSSYQKSESGVDWLPLTRTSLGASYLFEEHYELFAGLSLQNTAKNIGFSNTAQSGSTLSADVINLVPYFGAGIVFKPFFMRLQGFVPANVSYSDRVYIGTQLQMGAAF